MKKRKNPNIMGALPDRSPEFIEMFNTLGRYAKIQDQELTEKQKAGKALLQIVENLTKTP